MSTLVAADLQAAYRSRFPRSAEIFQRARHVFPSGVTHDSRHLKPFPVAIDRALGAHKWTAEGHPIIDYWMGHGALLLGHSHPAVVAAVSKQAALGTHYGASHQLETEWGEAVLHLLPAAERVRFTSSGTEATLMAIRLARMATGRQKILKFAGHFHGWHDWLMPAADGPYDLGHVSLPGVTPGVLQDLVVVPPNDLAALTAAIQEHQPACVILEGTGGHWSMVPMRGEFLRAVRKLTAETGTLLIFDEVITGFRVAPGGSQQHYGIQPDLTTLAKILAGGLPGGGVAGRENLMNLLEFENPHGQKMRHPGTYNGNPLSAAAGATALQLIAREPHCDIANLRGQQLRTGLNEVFTRLDVPWVAYGEFSMLTVLTDYSGPRPTSDDFIPLNNQWDLLDRPRDVALTHAFRCALLLNGVDFFGWRAMLSSAHTEADIAQTCCAMEQTIQQLRQSGLQL